MSGSSKRRCPPTLCVFAMSDPLTVALGTAMARAAELRLGGFIAQVLANSAWAFATLGQLGEVLLVALARAAEPRLGGFIAQVLANTAWAFATSGQLAVALFAALARAAVLPVRMDSPTLRGRSH